MIDVLFMLRFHLHTNVHIIVYHKCFTYYCRLYILSARKSYVLLETYKETTTEGFPCLLEEESFLLCVKKT